jgi:type II pantothenate kinase
MYGAFGRFLSENDLALSDVSRVMMTGVGSSYYSKEIYGLPSIGVQEFHATGTGALYLSGLPRAMSVSMGTGTAMVYAEGGKEMRYLGGTGVGGGTLLGLAKTLLGIESVEHLDLLAQEGDLSRVDLRIGDFARTAPIETMSADLTAANFGKVSDLATKADLALGLFNMVYETVGMMAIFAARGCGVRDIVLSGNLAATRYASLLFPRLSALFDVNFIIPAQAQFATVIGTALSGLSES